MVMNVMDPDRVFKGAEFNLLLPMKGRGHGKCRMGGKNTGGLLTVLPMRFGSQLGASGAFCILTAQKAGASPLPSRDATGSTSAAVPRVLPVVLELWLREEVLWTAALPANPCLRSHCWLWMPLLQLPT